MKQHPLFHYFKKKGNKIILYFAVLTSYMLIFTNLLTAGKWSVRHFSSEYDQGKYTSIALDNNGYPHIAYQDNSNADLMYCYYTGTEWVEETVEYEGSVGGPISMELNKDGEPNIIYSVYNMFGGDIRYAKKNGSSWEKQIVKNYCGYGVTVYKDIAIDISGNLYLSYISDWDLYYAYWNGNAWENYKVDEYVWGFDWNSINVDDTGKVLIVYNERGSQGFSSFRYVEIIGGSAQMQDVYVKGTEDYGQCISMDLDSNDTPNFAFFDSSNGDLKYAKLSGSSWEIETVDSEGNVGYFTSIKLDSLNKPHIAYYDITNKDLKYAKWTGSAWSIRVIDSIGDVGQYSSLALDSSNNPHIAYYDATNGDLCYAAYLNNAPTLTWTGETSYSTDGVSPDSGGVNDTYTFRVKYTDSDGDAPLSGYPKLYIKKNGVSISGSPFSMSFVSGSNSSGAIYTYSITLSKGMDYSYYFEAYDSDNAPATGQATVSQPGPIVTNLPVLSWTGETNYTNDGVYPRSGKKGDTYTFRIKYIDEDKNPPADGYPKINIFKNGIPLTNSPFEMIYVSGDYDTGAIYSYAITLNEQASMYSYSFSAKNIYNAIAIGEPTDLHFGPLIVDNVPVEQKMKIYHGVFKPEENESCHASYNLSENAEVTVKVYDTLGREIKELYKGFSGTGVNTVSWDGTDSNGNKVSSGVYYIHIKGGGINQHKKVVVIR